jgi:hypothetical protein
LVDGAVDQNGCVERLDLCFEVVEVAVLQADEADAGLREQRGEGFKADGALAACFLIAGMPGEADELAAVVVAGAQASLFEQVGFEVRRR